MLDPAHHVGRIGDRICRSLSCRLSCRLVRQAARRQLCSQTTARCIFEVRTSCRALSAVAEAIPVLHLWLVYD